MKFLPKNQLGSLHTLPLFLIIAAIGILAFLLLTSTAPFSSGLFSNIFPKNNSKAATTTGFLETFAYGTPNVPTPFNSPRWQLVAGSGNVDGLKSLGPSRSDESHGFLEAGHGPNCEPPLGNTNQSLNNHVITIPLRDSNNNLINPSTYSQPLGLPQGGNHIDPDLYEQQVVPNLFYICNNHMMTVMLAGYDIDTFMPRYQLDWTGGRTQTIQWEAGVYGLGREWFDVYIAKPDELTMWADENDGHINQGGSEDTEPKNVLVLTYNGGAFRFEQWQNWQYLGDVGAPNYCGVLSPGDPACNDPRLRRQFRVSFNQSTITMQIQNQNGTWVTSYSGNLLAPLSFSVALARFEHHSYNASKDIGDIPGATQTVYEPATGGTVTENPLAWGSPYSLYTYHWGPISFDGPANPDHQAYIPNPSYLNFSSAGQTKTIHVNVTNADIRNPSIQMMTVTEMQNQAGDPYDHNGWLRYRINGGVWQNFHNVRDGAPFVNIPAGDDEITNATWDGPLSGLHVGDNTLDINFDHIPSGLTWEQGFQSIHISPIEVHVAPTSDMPPANPTGGVIPTATPTNSSIPTPTVTSTATPIADPTPTPTPTAIPGTTTVTFDGGPAAGPLNGQYPTGLIDWGSNSAWLLSGPYSVFNTNSFSYNGAGPTSGTFTFVTPATLVSLQAANGGSVATTVTVSCNPPAGSLAPAQAKSVSVPLNQLTTITTGFTMNCSSVTISSTNGWDTNFDNLVVATGQSTTPTPTPSAGKPGDINGDGVVNIFDYNILVGNFGKACTVAQGDLDGNGTCNIFDYNIIVSNFGK